MKIKNLKPICTALLLGGITIFSHTSYSDPTNNFRVVPFKAWTLSNTTNYSATRPLDTIRDKAIIEAAKILNKFGKKIASGKLSQADLKLISILAKIPLPNPSLFDQDAILATGINFKTEEPVLLSSITGKSISPCAQITNHRGPRRISCDVKAIPPNEAVQRALENTKPIPGEIIVNGKKVPATYIVNVMALYKGSMCMTHYIGGRQYKFCY